MKLSCLHVILSNAVSIGSYSHHPIRASQVLKHILKSKKISCISWSLKMEPRGPETSVRNYHNTLRNNSEERRYYRLISCLIHPWMKSTFRHQVFFHAVLLETVGGLSSYKFWGVVNLKRYGIKLTPWSLKRAKLRFCQVYERALNF
jgi:hypothetical protein